MSNYQHAAGLARNGLLFTCLIAQLNRVPQNSQGYLSDVLGYIDSPERYIDSAQQLCRALTKDNARKIMRCVTEHIAIYARDPEAYMAYVVSLAR